MLGLARIVRGGLLERGAGVVGRSNRRNGTAGEQVARLLVDGGPGRVDTRIRNRDLPSQQVITRDNVPAKRSKGLEAFGIEPTALGSVASEWLGRFRQGGRWSANAVDQAA